MAEYSKGFFPGWSHSVNPSWASMTKNSSISPQWHHTTCEQRGRKPKSNHGQTMAEIKKTVETNAFVWWLLTDYQEHLHESPFHKLAAKIKHHHSKHAHHSHSHSHPISPTSPPKESYVNSESFYGSVDVTQSITPNRNNNETAEDSARAYDNNITATPNKPANGHASPRYDPVPNPMVASQESNQSERIYAEVEESMITGETYVVSWFCSPLQL